MTTERKDAWAVGVGWSGAGQEGLVDRRVPGRGLAPSRVATVLPGLEREPAVEKWFKPGRGVFQIRYTSDHDYEPDFVVETRTEKLLCEPKRGDQVTDPLVLAKANAASQWCRHATDYELQHGGKPWRYLLIPHDFIAANSSLDGLIERFTVTAADEGRGAGA